MTFKYRKYLISLGLFALSLFLSQVVIADTAVSWTSPADGSSYPVGTTVSPIGNASGIGSTGTGLDLAIVLDSSGSMGTLQSGPGGVRQSRQQWQRDAAIELVNNLPASNTAVSVIEFDSNAGVVIGLTPLLTNTADIINAINSVDAGGSTYIGTGIDAAIAELTGANATEDRSQHMVVFSDGASRGSPATNAAAALVAGVDAVHSVALPGARLSTMESIATSGGGTFIDASSEAGLQDLFDVFSGTAGSLVGIDYVDIIMPDNSVIGSVQVDAFGNFQTPDWMLALGPNTFTANAYGTDGTTASAMITLYGTDVPGGGTDDPPSASVPEPGTLGLLSLGLIGLYRARRRRD